MKVRYYKDDVDLVMVEGAEAIAIVAVEKLNLFLGEWFRDENVGIPWLQSILGGKLTTSQVNFISNTLVNELSTIPEVTQVEITNIDFDATSRHLKITIKLTHLEGETTLEQSYGL